MYNFGMKSSLEGQWNRDKEVYCRATVTAAQPGATATAAH